MAFIYKRFKCKTSDFNWQSKFKMRSGTENVGGDFAMEAAIHDAINNPRKNIAIFNDLKIDL